MKTQIILTITCPDRPGIVEQIAAAMGGFEANWEESRMARLGGDFAGIVKISVTPEQVESLTQTLRGLADDETAVTVKVTTPESTQPAAEVAVCELVLEGADHEGIVNKVSAYLAGRAINVESMESDVVPAPMSATPVFQMRALIKVPEAVEIAQLQDDLNMIGESLGVEIRLETP